MTIIYNTRMDCHRCGRYAYHQLHPEGEPPDPATALCDSCAGRTSILGLTPDDCRAALRDAFKSLESRPASPVAPHAHPE